MIIGSQSALTAPARYRRRGGAEHEANPRCSIATDVAAHVAQHAFGALKAAPQMVTAPHTPVPFSPVLEDLYIPTSDAIAAAASKTLGRTETR